MGLVSRKLLLISAVCLIIGSAVAQVDVIFKSGFEDGEGSAATLPPDPQAIAPERPQGYSTSPCEAASFLYDSLTPVQFNVDESQIDCEFVSIIAGRVLDSQDAPLPGVKVAVKDHPELGHTLTRTDGHYDMVVNGGGLVTLQYSGDDVLPAQRDAKPPAQTDIVLEDVILIGLDANATTVESGQPTVQVVTGTTSLDIDGERTARLIIPPNTNMYFDDGQGGFPTINTLDIRITEYTVGPNGPAMMPAKLPQTTGYTYAVEYSADQNPDYEIKFSKPLASYNENFLGFPTGTIVPHGYFDEELNQWVPSENGRVVEVLSNSGSTVTLAVDGSGAPASAQQLSSLGVIAEELEMLSQLYTTGDTLWRVPVSHFSPHDYNFPLPNSAEPPPLLPPLPDDFDPDKSDPQFGQIEFQTQTFQEQLDLVGVPFSLHYSSDRTPGRIAGRSRQIPVTGPVVAPEMVGTKVITKVGGKRTEYNLGTAPNQFLEIQWDGLDRYSRPVFGTQKMSYQISYEFEAVYSLLNINDVATEPSRIFGTVLSFPDSLERSTLIVSRPTEFKFSMPGILDWRPLGVAGWSPSVHHYYDAAGGTVYKGDGTRQGDGGNALAYSLNQFGGTGDDYDSDGIPANEAYISADHIAVASDGTVYFSEEIYDWDGNQENVGALRIRAINPDGTMRTVVAGGNANYCESTGSIPANLRLEGWDASNPNSDDPIQLTIDNNDRLIFSATTCIDETYTNVEGDFHPVYIFRVESDGSITKIVGNDFIEIAVEGFFTYAPAEDFPMVSVNGLDVFPDGTLAIQEKHTFHRLEADGWVRHLGGGGACFIDYCSPDGTPSVDAVIEIPNNMVTMPDGSIVFSGIQKYNPRQNILRRLTNDGILETVVPGVEGRWYYSLAAGQDGTIYANVSNPGYPLRKRIIAIEPDGNTTTIAGNDIDQPYWSNNGLARQRRFDPYDMDIGPDGAIYGTTDGIERIVPGDEPVSTNDALVASNSGPEVFRFSSTGRHLETRHALTGGLLWDFAYDSEGYLTGITDGYGNTTTISRSASGLPLAITGPDNHVTSFTTDADGYLATSTTPGNAVAQFQYASGGLLNRVETATNDVYSMTYDPKGRLLSVKDPFNKSYTLARTVVPGGIEVEVTSPTGLKTTYSKTVDGNRSLINTITGSNGLQSTSTTQTDGRTTLERSDGVVMVTTMAPDPRFAMQAPYPALMSVEFPGGTTESMTQLQTATLQNTGSVLDLQTLALTQKLGTETTSVVFDGIGNQQTVTTATGVTKTFTIDEQGALVGMTGTAIPAMAPMLDGRGRIESMDMGEGGDLRSTQFNYNNQGLLNRVTSANSLETDFVYDADLRVTEMVLPDGASQYSGFDAAGFEVSVTPPDGDAVLLAPDARNSLVSITYPDAGNGVTTTLFGYDDDKRPITETRANAAVLTHTFNGLGQVSALDYSDGQLTFEYDALTGQKTKITAPEVTLDRVFDGPWMEQEVWSGAVAGSVERVIAGDRVRRQAVTVNGTDSIAYGYSPLLTSVGTMTLSYHANTEQLATTSQGLVSDEYEYDAEGRLESYTAKINGSDYFSYALSFDELSRITDISETKSSATNTHSFSYDNRGNLATVDLNASNVSSFVYDPRGNRTTVTTGANDVDATYDAQDRQLTRGTVTFDYDADGVLTAMHSGANTTSYVYDEFSNLLQVTLPDNSVIDYAIDGVHRRVERRIDGVRTAAWLYENNRIVAELDAADTVTSRFVYGTFKGAPDYVIRGAKTYRLIKDHLGSVRAVIDTANGSVMQEMAYDSWGVITSDTNPGFQPFGFTGGLYDPHTGFTRLGARDYLASSARWTTRDPIGFAGGTNFYSYVGNNPVNFTDEHGLLAPLIVVALGLGAAAISENIALQHGTGAGVASSTVGSSVSNGLTGGTALPTTVRGVVSAIGARSFGGVVSAAGGALGTAFLPYAGGKALGWIARQAGRDSVADASANAGMFGIDMDNLTIGEQNAVDDLLRRINESDGTNIDELNQVAHALEVLKDRANARRKGL